MTFAAKFNACVQEAPRFAGGGTPLWGCPGAEWNHGVLGQQARVDWVNYADLIVEPSPILQGVDAE